MIVYNNDEVKMPIFPKRKITKWIRSTSLKYNKRVGDISYIFCSDEKILKINKQFLNHDYYTDIITFDYSKKNIISGDIFISVDSVKSNAEKFDTTFINELFRVIIHGILHLCGINDKNQAQRVVMEENENCALLDLKEFL
jgi:metalloprotein, YbeY/UPF0054 family